MKTPEDILCTCTVGGYGKHGEQLYDRGEIKEAMKEYAKQWVKEALQNEPDSFIEYYLKQIDEQ